MTLVTWAEPLEPRLPDARVAEAVAAALEVGGRPDLELAVVFVGQEALTELHARHLGDPTPTDVITFDLGQEGQGPAGELYVSVDRAREVGLQREVPFERELLLYVVHGALHLCGLDDHESKDRERMRAAEREALEQLGFPPDETPHEME